MFSNNIVQTCSFYAVFLKKFVKFVKNENFDKYGGLIYNYITSIFTGELTMKKLLKIMTAAAVLLCGLALTGCGLKEIVKQTVDDSYNQWFKYKSTKQIDIPVVDHIDDDDPDTDPESATKLKNAEIYFYFNPDAGLTIAIQSVTTQEVELLKGLYKQNLDVVMGSTKAYPNFGKKSWYTLWGSGKLEESDAPKIYTNPDECIVLGQTDSAGKKPSIQWKKFIANYLLDSLLED